MKIKITKKKIESFVFPKRIILLGQSYRIKTIHRGCKKYPEDYAGRIILNKGIIEISKKLDKKSAEYTMFHEFGHFFAHYYNLEQSEMFAEAFANYVKGVITQMGYARK